MSEGVEWAAHCCLLLAWLDQDRPVPTAKLAAGFELPPAYLNKQLQALVRGEILTSTPGPKGGFRLARPLSEITLMDVVTAIEGPEQAFRCTEIRKNGAGAATPERYFTIPCQLDLAFGTAELAWRKSLAAQTLADVQAAAEANTPSLADNLKGWYARSSKP